MSPPAPPTPSCTATPAPGVASRSPLPRQDVIKRTVDVAASAFGLILLAPIFVAVAVAIRWETPGPAFFRQRRIGREFRPFQILKFRTMVVDAPRLGGSLTAGADPRITRVGRVLRKTKIDELPQLINVIRGDMSLVGPRPEVPRYVELFRDQYQEILSVRPGITGLDSLTYRDESSLLGQADDPEQEYVQRILPRKLALAREYLHRRTLWFDLSLVAHTLLVPAVAHAPQQDAQPQHAGD